VNKPLRLKIAHYLTAGFADQIKALKEADVLPEDDPAAERLAEQFLREATTAGMFMADHDERRLRSDHSQGQYREEVQKLVDGVVEDVNGCKVPTQAIALTQLYAACYRSPYANDPAFFPAVLEYGGHPSAYLTSAGERETDPRSPVPWQQMAFVCLWFDARQELLRRPEYLALPSGD
jgi:hypothetical protein